MTMAWLSCCFASTFPDVPYSNGTAAAAVASPIHTQHYMKLQRNLLYTAVIRARKLVVLVGTRKAIAIAVKRVEAGKRITTLW